MKRPQTYFRRPYNKIQTCNTCVQQDNLHNKRVKKARTFFTLIGVCMLLLAATSIIDYIPISTILAGLALEYIFE